MRTALFVFLLSCDIIFGMGTIAEDDTQTKLVYGALFILLAAVLLRMAGVF